MLFSDAHIHLDFIAEASELALRAAEDERHIFATTVSPYGYMKMRMRFSGNPWIVPGLGFHPWWVSNDVLQPADLALFERLAPEAAFVGEVGLDFMGPRKHSASDQVDAFDRIIEACVGPLDVPCATSSHKRVISLHSAKAAGAVLDVLERWDATAENACVFHWFSGSCEELQRAISMGCYFSVGERMVRSKKGREYVKLIPADRLLLETDAPGKIEPAMWDSATYGAPSPVPDPRLVSLGCQDWGRSLESVAAAVREIKGCGPIAFGLGE